MAFVIVELEFTDNADSQLKLEGKNTLVKNASTHHLYHTLNFKM